MLMGRRHESLRVAESVVEGVSAIPAIVRVMPLSWTATLISLVGLQSGIEQGRDAGGGLSAECFNVPRDDAAVAAASRRKGIGVVIYARLMKLV